MFDMMKDFREKGVFTELFSRISTLEKSVRGIHSQETEPAIDSACKYALSALIDDIPDATLATIELDREVYDTGDNFTTNDFYGAAGAYTQADGAGCGPTTIKKAGAGFEDDPILSYSRVFWASDAAGTTDTGSGYIVHIDNPTTLTIIKGSGADFANGYYFYIKKNYYTVPKSGLYAITTRITNISPEKDAPYVYWLWAVNVDLSAGRYIDFFGMIPPSFEDVVTNYTIQDYLTEGERIQLSVHGSGILPPMHIQGGALLLEFVYTSLSICRISS